MAELNLDAESVTRNKSYGAIDHLEHLLKIGWMPDSPLIKNFLSQNGLTNNDLEAAIFKLNQTQS